MHPSPRHAKPPSPARPRSRPPRHLTEAPTSSRRKATRRSRTLVVVVCVAALAAGLVVSANAISPFGERRLRPPALEPQAAWFGAWVKATDPSEAVQQAAVTALEDRIGRRLGIDPIDVAWGQGLGARPAWDVAQGRIPLITFGARFGTRAVVSGRGDAYLRSLAAGVRALGRPVFLRYAPEMNEPRNRAWVDAPAGYVAAWRHVHDLFAGVRAAWVWSPSARAFDASPGSARAFDTGQSSASALDAGQDSAPALDAGRPGAARYYPGDQYVDWIGTDAYNAYGCRAGARWTELADLLKGFYAWGSGRNKPLMVAETGSTEDPADPGRKARWFDHATTALAGSMPNVEAVVYVDATLGCDWRSTTSPRAAAAFKRMAQDPHFAAQLALAPATTVPPTTVTRPPATRPPATTTPAPTTPAPTTTVGGGSGGGVRANLAPASGTLFGSSRWSPELEGQLGRKLDIAHFYHLWDQPFPTPDERSLAAGGRYLLLNWKPARRGGGKVTWAAVASGREDAQIAATAARIRSLGAKLFLTFHHEPEDEVGQWGSAADYAAAWRHVHDTFAALGVTNVVWVWDMMGFVQGWGGLYPQLYPGDRYVDWIAWDPYNWAGCRSGVKWRTFSEITRPFYDWATASHPGKPLMLAEYGTMEQAAGAKARWFLDELASLRTERPQLKAVVYFNTGPPDFGTCNWRVTSSPASLDAFRRIGLDPHLHVPH